MNFQSQGLNNKIVLSLLILNKDPYHIHFSSSLLNLLINHFIRKLSSLDFINNIECKR